MTTVTVGSMHKIWSDDDLVILEPVYHDKPISRFCDDVWMMDSLTQPSNTIVPNLIFRGLSDINKQTAKELMATRLNFPCVRSRTDTVQRHYSPFTVQKCLWNLRPIFEFMDQCRIAQIPDIKQTDIDRYQAMITLRIKTVKAQAHALTPFIWLWESRNSLSHGGLGFDPWKGKSPFFVLGWEKADENTTKRIPAPVMSGLLRWALLYIDHLSRDILAAERAYSGPDAIEADVSRPGDRFAAYVDHCRRARHGLPGIVHGGVVRVCRSLVAKRAGIPESWLTSAIGRSALTGR